MRDTIKDVFVLRQKLTIENYIQFNKLC